MILKIEISLFILKVIFLNMRIGYNIEQLYCYINRYIIIQFNDNNFGMIYCVWLTVKEEKSNAKRIGLSHFDLTYLSVRPEMKRTSG